jgi:hypothetical protein
VWGGGEEGAASILQRAFTQTRFYLDALLLRLCRGVSLLRLDMKMQQYLDQMCAQLGAFEVMSYPKMLLLRLSMKVGHYLDWTKYGSKYCQLSYLV